MILVPHEYAKYKPRTGCPSENTTSPLTARCSLSKHAILVMWTLLRCWNSVVCKNLTCTHSSGLCKLATHSPTPTQPCLPSVPVSSHNREE